jgi:hypothetical protein
MWKISVLSRVHIFLCLLANNKTLKRIIGLKEEKWMMSLASFGFFKMGLFPQPQQGFSPAGVCAGAEV